ncbi:hypothetical protein H8E77_41930 [bacterium]|nr:hypothetical protein [bacterium]
MKKLILAGIVIIICCLVFLIVKQNSSRADIGMDICAKPYPVLFSDWVLVYLNAYTCTSNSVYSETIWPVIIEGNKMKFKVRVVYHNNEFGRAFYLKSGIKSRIEVACEQWTAQGYPISLNDFEFDIRVLQ